ncbi:hypothetical protein [Methylocapsa aurea]|uniref:hypothetical protein n=1 Tax=Methylocapsa aurea TaxID=663610 RepID=UPI003D18F08D
MLDDILQMVEMTSQLAGARVVAHRLDTRHQYRDRRPQFMRGIGVEAALPRDSGVDSRQRVIYRDHERGDLVRHVAFREPLIERLGVDSSRLIRGLVQGLQSAPQRNPADGDRDAKHRNHLFEDSHDVLIQVENHLLPRKAISVSGDRVFSEWRRNQLFDAAKIVLDLSRNAELREQRRRAIPASERDHEIVRRSRQGGIGLWIESRKFQRRGSNLEVAQLDCRLDMRGAICPDRQ